MQEPEISVVVPVYKEEGSIHEFLNRMGPILQSHTENYEIIFALDPSPDRTEEKILEARAQDPRIKVLCFSRRVGQPLSTLAGLQYSRGRAAVVIDVDLQDPPELILEMIKKWKLGFDVIYAQRRTREGETLIKKWVAATGYRIINKIADVKIPPNTGDFRLMSRRVVDEVVKLNESHGFLRGMVAVVGFKQTSILFDRTPRFAGQGNYNRFLGSIRIGVNGIICFSNKPLTLAWFGAGLCFSISFVLFLVWLFSFNSSVGIVSLVFFVSSIQLLSVGILGEYIGRIYDEVKRRPRFIVDRSAGF